MFRKMLSTIKSFGRRIRKSVVNTVSKIKRFAKNACQHIATSPAAAIAVSAVVTAAATVVAVKIGELKLIKSVVATGVMFISGLTCIAVRNAKAKKDEADLRAYCDNLIAQEEQDAEANH